jgi:hypothetical protein
LALWFTKKRRSKACCSFSTPPAWVLEGSAVAAAADDDVEGEDEEEKDPDLMRSLPAGSSSFARARATRARAFSKQKCKVGENGQQVTLVSTILFFHEVPTESSNNHNDKKIYLCYVSCERLFHENVQLVGIRMAEHFSANLPTNEATVQREKHKRGNLCCAL